MNQPLRTCVGCRRVALQAELVRYVLVDGVVTRDDRRRLPGRGAWVHDDDVCWQAAQKRGGLGRALRRVDKRR